MKYILITGASTGIGRSLTTDLVSAGYTVFAGARKPQDLEALRKLGEKVIPLALDVTVEEDLKRSFELVKIQLEKFPGTFSLVNNAGLALAGPVEGLSLTSVRHLFEVNVFGALRATQVFLPLIKNSRGRVIMMSSVSGLTSFPLLGAYGASKFSLEALSDALRMELSQTGVKVVLIEPGPIQTPIWEKNISQKEKLLADLPDEIRNQYQAPLERFARATVADLKHALPTSAVTKKVLRALEEKNPPARLRVLPWAANLGYSFLRCLPTKLQDSLFWGRYARK